MIKFIITSRTTRAELGAAVCEALHEDLGDMPVLVGGSTVCIYTEGRFRSDDLDITTRQSRAKIRPVMTKLGFIEKGMYWEHPEAKLLVQFLEAPPMVGHKYVASNSNIPTSAGNLPIVSPLDSACDRFLWFLEEGDRQTLEQCADIIVTQSVPIQDVATWLRGEGYSDKEKKGALRALEKRVRALSKKRSTR